MRIGVIVFPGSNCDQDMVDAWESFEGNTVFKIWHKDTNLQHAELIVLPGGFSYGDYLRSGAIARFSPVMNEVISFAARGGLILGVCNGFQILCEAGLLPGALLHNNNQKFICKNVYIKASSNGNPFTSGLINSVFQIPIAHGEGRFYADADELQKLNNNEQILFRYCDQDGYVSESSNPNGAVENIAGVCNAGKNVFGMMPHPERAMNDISGNSDGQLLFKNLLQNIKTLAVS